MEIKIKYSLLCIWNYFIKKMNEQLVKDFNFKYEKACLERCPRRGKAFNEKSPKKTFRILRFRNHHKSGNNIHKLPLIYLRPKGEN